MLQRRNVAHGVAIFDGLVGFGRATFVPISQKSADKRLPRARGGSAPEVRVSKADRVNGVRMIRVLRKQTGRTAGNCPGASRTECCICVAPRKKTPRALTRGAQG